MKTQTISTLVILGVLSTAAFAQKAPPQAEWDKASADITGTDAAAQTAALEKIKTWVKGGWVSADVFRKWLPALVKANRHQDAYDLATLAPSSPPRPPFATARANVHATADDAPFTHSLSSRLA